MERFAREAHGTNLMICKDQKVDLVIFVKIPVSGSDDGLWRDHKAEACSVSGEFFACIWCFW